MMLTETRTLTAETRNSRPGDLALRGLICVFANHRPTLLRFPMSEGPLELGRGSEPRRIPDQCTSRLHARVRHDGEAWVIEDLRSRNGTWVDGRRIERVRVAAPRVLRIGGALLVPSDNVFEPNPELLRHPDRPIVGARLARMYDTLATLASSRTLHIGGESGSGKELAARRFHELGPRRDGPFVAVNCATIPSQIAERVLFGAKKGAYTGATADSDGLVQSAAGGTLFLDEIAELDAGVQAKLLRLLDSGEVLPLGATRPQRVELGICTASHVELARVIAAGTFRADLGYRIAEPSITVPPLRERLDEIPWHVQRALEPSGKLARAEFVEACMLAPWPGNVRQLYAVVRAAAARVSSDRMLHASDLVLPDAGLPERAEKRTAPSDEEIRLALEAHGGNVSATARALGMHRTQLRRWLAKHGDRFPLARDVAEPALAPCSDGHGSRAGTEPTPHDRTRGRWVRVRPRIACARQGHVFEAIAGPRRAVARSLPPPVQ